jgi:hypothetical protein
MLGRTEKSASKMFEEQNKRKKILFDQMDYDHTPFVKENYFDKTIGFDQKSLMENY